MCNGIKKYLCLLFVTILTACSIHPPLEIAQLPTSIEFERATYQQIRLDNLGKVIRAVYRPLSPSLQAKDRYIEIFQDLQQDFAKTDPYFVQRKALRQRTFTQNQLQYFALMVQHQQLLGFVIYPPIPQSLNYQVDVFRGENKESCGFLQIQYSQIFPLSALKGKTEQQLFQQFIQQVAKPKLLALSKISIPWRCYAR